MSPLLAKMAAEGGRRQVGLEALLLACILETGAATFVPGQVAREWCHAVQERAALRAQRQERGSSAAGQEGHDPQRALDGLARDDPLMHLCAVLPDLRGLTAAVGEHMGVKREQAQHGLMEVKVSVARLPKAKALWWRSDPQQLLRRSTLSSSQQSRVLLDIMARIFPHTLGERDEIRWFAAAHRIRGEELPVGGSEEAAFLFNPRPSHWTRPGDHDMTHLRALFCMPWPSGEVSLAARADSMLQRMVIIGDSTLDLPGVRYGLACQLRKKG
jgi:hypothetical protein